jgi:SAM-dependent methyltransferase
MAAEPAVLSALDVGGGANPVLPPSLNDTRCTLADIDPDELAKAPSGYGKQVVDFSVDIDLKEQFDLIISHFVCEHISNPIVFHKNILKHLRPDGRAVHFFPTLFAPPFLFNSLVPERVSDRILHRFQSDREQDGHHGKFPAYYRWCRGPSKRQIMRFTSLGFEVEQYVGCFGHPLYYQRWPRLERVERKASAWLVEHPVPYATSYAYIVMRRPSA